MGIKDLTIKGSVSDADNIPIYDSESSRSRAVTAGTIKKYCLDGITESVTAGKAALSLPVGESPTVNATVGDVVHLDVATESGVITGSSFTVGSDGYITANRDMFGVAVSAILIGSYGNNDSLSFGVAIGDPSAIPTVPGTSNGECYLSRLRDQLPGKGSERDVTLNPPYEIYGSNTTEGIGVKSGDKIFPVMWTDEGTPVSVTVSDLIFIITESHLG